MRGKRLLFSFAVVLSMSPPPFDKLRMRAGLVRVQSLRPASNRRFKLPVRFPNSAKLRLISALHFCATVNDALLLPASGEKVPAGG